MNDSYNILVKELTSRNLGFSYKKSTINGYVVDFYFSGVKLIVEIDSTRSVDVVDKFYSSKCSYLNISSESITKNSKKVSDLIIRKINKLTYHGRNQFETKPIFIIEKSYNNLILNNYQREIKNIVLRLNSFTRNSFTTKDVKAQLLRLFKVYKDMINNKLT